MPKASPAIEILYFAGCPNYEPTVNLAREVLDELGLEAEVRGVAVETPAEAEAERFIGSPSVRINGVDIESDVEGRTDFALCCRVYGRGGVPARKLLVDALKKDQ